ncbi:hypothetical protein K439DRAFT_1637346 [Ramaria rubella]|nr:hypothetical protein K439DRAFT_1637346 [Ramaria rubella]
MDLEIVYHIEDAHQFWTELEDILQVSASSTLIVLDAMVRSFVSFSATYHEQYLQTPVQLTHACSLLLDSEAFTSHSERLSSLVISDALSNTDPHAQLILHNVLLLHGRQHPSFFRSAKKWSELIPLLMDHILLVAVDCDVYQSGSLNAWRGGMGIPIEARLRQLAVMILYEVCRVQKFDPARLKVFNDAFIDHLFELVEVTRDMQDETVNYCLIKLIVALNEQFMVSALQPNKEDTKDKPKTDNRVIQILIRRLGSSKTFGENLIFMLNRADHSAEDRCMQLLVLKILYLLFTTPGTQEYFYTNDLHVLVDVFIRELVDLDEDSESLRHTYLRVLHPLLSHTQLRTVPYKRQQILRTLESLVAHAEIRDVSPTTNRLVERCLGGSWAVQLKKEREAAKAASTSASDDINDNTPASQQLHTHPLESTRYMKFSKSVDVINVKPPKEGTLKSSNDTTNARKTKPKPAKPPHLELRRSSGDSSQSLVSVAAAAPGPGKVQSPVSPTPSLPTAAHASSGLGNLRYSMESPRRPEPKRHPRSASDQTPGLVGDLYEVTPPTPVFEDPTSPVVYAEPEYDTRISPPRHRPAPAPPTKRRKPPAVPSRSTKAVSRERTTITTIASSKALSPLSRAVL